LPYNLKSLPLKKRGGKGKKIFFFGGYKNEKFIQK